MAEEKVSSRRRRKSTAEPESTPTRARHKRKEEVSTSPEETLASETPKSRRRKASAKSVSPEATSPETAQQEAPHSEETKPRTRRRKATAKATEAPPTEAVSTPPEGQVPTPTEPVVEEPKPRRRRRKTTTPQIEEAPAPIEPSPPQAVEEAPKAKPRRRRRKTATEGVEAPVEVSAQPQVVEEVPPVEAVLPVEEKKPRRRRRKAVEETPAPPLVEEAPPPQPPIRHPLVRVHFHQGIPSISVGERTFAPLFFFGNLTHAEAGDYVHREMQLATSAGVDLFSLLIPLPVRESGALEAFDQVRFWTAVAREVNPNAHILWRFVPAPVGNWQKEFPEAVIRYADGTTGGPSVCAERWWLHLKEQLVALVELIEREDEGSATLGYHLDWGEWFQPESGGYDTSESALTAFREWLRRHYKEDTVALRSCWFDGDVSFGTATLPPFQPSSNPQQLQFYHLRREGRWIDYQRFLSEITAKRILNLAQAVKTASQERALVGVPYGYLLEWRHPYSGHLGLAHLLKSEAIDFISAPITYAERLPGKSGAFPVPVHSVHLHHKLFLSEEDYRTPFGKLSKLSTLRDPTTERSLSTEIARGTSPTNRGAGVAHESGKHSATQVESLLEDDYNPPLRTADDVLKVQARSVGQSLVYGYGVQWMDLWGEGWLSSPLTWEGARTQKQLWEWRMRVPQSPPDIAVMIDPVSIVYVRAGSRLIEQVVVKEREALLRAGVSFGFYLLEDLVRRDFPPVKMVLFLNAWRPSQRVREAIRRKLQQGGRTLVWLYAGALFQGHRNVLETAREITGLALARQPWASTQGTQIVKPHHPIARALGTDKLGVQEPWEPSYYVRDEDCEVIGEYIETGLASFVVKDYDTWRTVFIGERTLTPELIRALARWAGVHVWTDCNDIVQVNPPWLHLHASQGGRKRIALPNGITVYDPAEGQIIRQVDGTYEIALGEGESRLLLVDTPERLEMLLRGESLPPIKVVEEESATPTLPEPAEEIPLLVVSAEPQVESTPKEPAQSTATKRRTPKRTRKEPAPLESVLAAVHWRRQPNGES